MRFTTEFIFINSSPKSFQIRIGTMGIGVHKITEEEKLIGSNEYLGQGL